MALCKICKLDTDDFDEMTYGDVIDYIDSYIEMKNPSKPEVVKKADQNDIDRFFG